MDSQTKGICRMGIVPVRSEPSDKAEMVTQLIFGDHYSVNKISNDGKWANITIESDQYIGWIDILLHKEISEEYFNHLNQTEFKICTDITAAILYKKRLIQIVMGSVLPLSSHELFDVNEQLAYNGSSKSIGEKQGFEFMKQILKNYMNAPYLWGGKTPFGIDCSGLTQMSFKLCGYMLKRDAHEQYHQGAEVSSIGEALAGDMAFFKNENDRISHVGIVIENQMILHASGYVRIDKLDEKGIYREDISNYTHNLAGIRRILKT